MNNYLILLIAVILIMLMMRRRKMQKNAAILNHRRNHKNREDFKMKELAKQFVGKECLIYTVASDSDAERGVIKEITENGILLDANGNLQAINLEYVTRIREWPRKKNKKD